MSSQSMKTKNILLINPWIYDVAAFDLWVKPIGLLTLASVLRNAGYQISLIDCLDRFHPALQAQPDIYPPQNKKYGTGKFIRQKVKKPAILEDVHRYYCRYGLPISLFKQELEKLPAVDAILVTSGMTYWYDGPLKAIEIVKQALPGVPVILGGIYATLCREHAQQFSGADYVIAGPGESQILGLLDEIWGMQTDAVDHPETIDDIPWPAYDLYSHLESLPILTSRGCPFRCPFCASRILMPKFEQRDPLNVADEIEFYSKSYGIREFAFWDDALLINQKRHLSVILNQLLERGVRAHFHTPNGMHPRELDGDLAKLMAKSQFKTIRLSYESSDADRQKAMGKVNDDELLRALDHLENAGIERSRIDVYVMMGLPFQTVDEISKTIEFVHRAGARITLTSYSPIPGTRDWELAKAYYQLSDEIDPLLTNNSIFPLKTTQMTAETFEGIKQLARSLNQKVIEKRKAAT